LNVKVEKLLSILQHLGSSEKLMQGKVLLKSYQISLNYPIFWFRCVKVRQILRTLLIRVEEKDLFMSKENQQELSQRTGSSTTILPQVFVDGQFLGVSLSELYPFATLIIEYVQRPFNLKCKSF
jgi:hypothetical protein